MDSIKRLNYFNHQFLKEEDFTDEQTYHREMRKQHNRVFHLVGVAYGLEVEKGSKKGYITISIGLALDSDGTEIIVPEVHDENLSSHKSKRVSIWIRYAEEKTDEYTAFGNEILEKMRISEEYTVELVTNEKQPSSVDDHEYLYLATVNIGKNGEVGKISEDDRRKKAGVVVEVPEVTLESIEALSVNGGEIKGKLSVVNREKNAIALDVRSQGKGPACWINVRSKEKEQMTTGLLVSASPTSKQSFKAKKSAAVAAVSILKDVVGIYAYSRPGTPSAYIEGDMVVSGNLNAKVVNAKVVNTGHITDVFINASKVNLLPGHVVQLNGSPIKRYRNGNIPVPEIVPSDCTYSTLIVGVVDGPVKPFDGEGSSDHIEASTGPGEECYVVILGCYSRCKVDATAAPVEVGDLLTSSARLGHAMKATEPTPGSIIGKALSPLSSGQEDIPILLYGGL